MNLMSQQPCGGEPTSLSTAEYHPLLGLHWLPLATDDRLQQVGMQSTSLISSY